MTWVGLDGDDTLWHSESVFAVTQDRFAELLAPYMAADEASARLAETEKRNLALFGYGVKGFTLSMIETAIEVSGGGIPAADIKTIIGYGRGMLDHPIELLPGVRETLEHLAERYRLVLVTKGDLFHQESKVAQSGLGDLFDRIEIVAEKDPPAYRRLLASLEAHGDEFVMVGNSLRSDVVAPLEAGSRAVYLPYEITWDHETAEMPTSPRILGRFREIDAISELPEILSAWEMPG